MLDKQAATDFSWTPHWISASLILFLSHTHSLSHTHIMSTSNDTKQPPVVLCIGMAGSGKTTFMQASRYCWCRNEAYETNNLELYYYSGSLHTNMQRKHHRTYSISILPWVHFHSQPTLIFETLSTTRRLWNSKIYDLFNYDQSESLKVLVNRYQLGPNGGILTSLNLFTTKFDQVLNLVAKRAENVR